jgi:hypothetical protein
VTLGKPSGKGEQVFIPKSGEISELPGSTARNAVASSVPCRKGIDFHHAKAHVRAVERRATDDALMETLDGPSFGRRRRSDGRQDPRGNEVRVGQRLRLCDEALLLQIAPSQPERYVLAAFESSVARQHGIGDEEPPTLNIQEQAERRSECNVAGNRQSFEIVGSHSFAAGEKTFV